MSAETDYRALLAAHAPLTALVGTRIAINSVPKAPDEGQSLVVVETTHDPQYGLDNSLHGDRVVHATRCWAQTSAQAEAIADAVRGALAGNGDYIVIAEGTVFEETYGLDGVELTVERWIV